MARWPSRYRAWLTTRSMPRWGGRYKVTDWASLNLKAERDIVSGSDEADLSKTRYTAGFGVTW